MHVHRDTDDMSDCDRRACDIGLRCVVKGKRVRKHEATPHAAAYTVMCAVPELVGGGCISSVSMFNSWVCVYVRVCACDRWC